jgi:integrase/recombinase XerC
MAFRALRELGEDVGDPTLDLPLPPRSSRAARPLTDDEVALCRASTRLGGGSGTLLRAVAWALAEATAVTSEIPVVCGHGLDDPSAPRWVRLPGTRRHDPRLGELSEWGSVVVARQLRMQADMGELPSAPLAYRGRAQPGQAGSQAAVCNAVAAVLDLAGLADQPDVRPGSVRNWAGRRLFDDGLPLQQVARRMGCRSLDTCAEDIGLEWRDTGPMPTGGPRRSGGSVARVAR